MWKPILVGSAALAIAGSSLVYAQQRDHDGAGMRHRGFNFSLEDRSAFTDARIAALKAGLRLTPDQEKNWPAFETALRDIGKARMEQRAAMRERGARSDDPIERMRRRADMMTNAGTALKRLADAQEPLYKSLDDGQKNRFRLLGRVLTGPRAAYAQMRHHGGRHGDHMMMKGPGGERGMMGPRGDRGGRGDRTAPAPEQGSGGNL